MVPNYEILGHCPDGGENLLGLRSVADDITEAYQDVRFEFTDILDHRIPSLEICVDIGKNCVSHGRESVETTESDFSYEPRDIF